MPAAAQVAPPKTPSHLRIMNIRTGEKKAVYDSPVLIEAPNWSRDGRFLIYNSLGHLYKIPAAGGQPVQIDTGDRIKNNNDHGLSPDGQWIAISDQSKDGHSRVYVLPYSGMAGYTIQTIDGDGKLSPEIKMNPIEVTPAAPSYWHGWSPDGKTLAFVGQRKGEFDIYTVPVEGGAETQLTDAIGLDDGPDYDPAGHIWFNSVRTGHMQIWRMKADGSDETQITKDDAYGDWFPHPSPDGKWVLFLSFKGDVVGHPPGQHVKLRLIPADGSAGPKVVTELYGGQGTLNVNSWAPDSEWFAFVEYDDPEKK
jgi:Tol biopolymer transport system component